MRAAILVAVVLALGACGSGALRVDPDSPEAPEGRQQHRRVGRERFLIVDSERWGKVYRSPLSCSINACSLIYSAG